MELLPGTLDMLILQTLSHGPRHGYDIAKFINETSGGTFKILDGALYSIAPSPGADGLADVQLGIVAARPACTILRADSAGAHRVLSGVE